MSDAADPLRRNVSFLGSILGETIVENEGQSVYDLEETIRSLSKARRASRKDDHLDRSFEKAIAALDVGTAERIARAFAQYFQLVNLAEQHHRIRRRPNDAGERPIVAELRALAEKVDLKTLEAALPTLSTQLVFTAHPTEAQRRTVLEKHEQIARLLDTLDDEGLSREGRREAESDLRDEVGLLYQTDEIRQMRPRVGDEVKNVIFYLEEVLYPLIPRVYESLESALEAAYGQRVELPAYLRFGSWVGADMDGNPNVTPEVAVDTAFALASRAAGLHLTNLEELGVSLSQSDRRVRASEELLASIARDHAALPELAGDFDPRTDAEPYRRKLRWMEARLSRTRDGLVAGRRGLAFDRGPTDAAYSSAAELLEDVRILERSLVANRGGRAGLRRVRAFRRRVEVFGLHLAKLDLRVPAQWMRDAIAASLWQPQAGSLSVPLLHEALTSPRIPARPDTPGMRAMEALVAMHRRVMPESVESFILSMAHGHLDLLATLVVARIAGAYRPDENRAELSVVPLFETLDDLERAPAELEAAFADPHYRAYLALRGDVQEVMLGYSDSNKDAGIVASSFALYETQRKLVAVGARHGITIAIFHGRGGSIGRGGGPAQRAIEGLPPGSIGGRFKLTEQGEVIGWKYLLPRIAERNLEQTAGGVLRATLDSNYPSDDELADYEATFRDVSRKSVEAYRALVRHPRFVEYYSASTPLDEIGALPLGSRPARRSGQATLDDLRAIPWVFAFTQSRQNVPGWYGAGTALRYLIRTKGLAYAKRMRERWPFFSTMLDAIAVAVATSDMRITRHYASLVPDKELAKSMFRKIAFEHGHADRAVREILGAKTILESKPRLARSIALRNPYVDPMSFIQVELIRRKREIVAKGEAVPADLDRAILLTINGIAAGLRNTG